MSANGKSIDSLVPHAITDPCRIPAARYHDPAFFDLEKKQLWSRVWQMACRLDEIKKPGDYVEYALLDWSVIVIRVDENRVKAYHNHCRHRGQKLVKDRGNAKHGFSCSFHGWRFNMEGQNTFVYQPSLFREQDLDPADLALRPCRSEIWGGAVFVNFDDSAPPLQEAIKPFADYHDARKVGDMHVRWWYSAIVPSNWKIAIEAFQEGYHLMRTHPQFLPSGGNAALRTVYKPLGAMQTGNSTVATQMQSGAKDNSGIIDASIHYLKMLQRGMDSMVLEKDVKIAESLRGTKLPDDPDEARKVWNRTLNEAMTREHRKNGIPVPDFAELSKTTTQSVQFCFPNFFLLPMYGNMASYRFRPLGPETTLYEVWSLTLYPEGEEPKEPLSTPTPMAFDDPRWPEIPPQDFANVPEQQKGLHSQGFEFMRLSNEVEGLISHYQQTIDGFLAGYDHKKLLPAIRVAQGPIDAKLIGRLFD